jgi:hypothetical protein
MQIHMHEELPHGTWIINILSNTDLDAANLSDLEEGAKVGAILYLRMVDWALHTDALIRSFPDMQLAEPQQPLSLSKR